MQGLQRPSPSKSMKSTSCTLDVLRVLTLGKHAYLLSLAGLKVMRAMRVQDIPHSQQVR